MMIAFLPPISAITRLTWSWPGLTSAAWRLISSPTSREPVKAIEVDAGVVDQRLADLLAQARQEVEHARRQAGLVEDAGAGARPSPAIARPA